MRPPVLRRLLASLTTAAIALLGAPAPALAAAPGLDLFVRSFTLSPGDSAYLNTTLFADRVLEVAPASTQVVYRVSGAAPGVHLQESGTPGNCRASQPDLLTLTCGTYGRFSPAGEDSGTNGYVQLDADAQVGAVATLTATLTVRGYSPVTRTARIRVGEAVDLTAPEEIPAASVAPAGPFDVPLTVTNSGTVPVRGAGLNAGTFYSFQSRAQYSNCWYLEGAMRGCRFDQTLEPGVSYRVTLPYRIRRDTWAPSEQYGGWSWATADDFDDLRSYFVNSRRPYGTPGRGGVLRLTEVATAKADPPQSDPTGTGTSIKVTVTGRQVADLAAVGARASGRAGSTVSVAVGLRNRGPAVIDRTSFDTDHFATTVVVIPRGTTAVKVPDRCFPLGDNGQPDYNYGNTPGRPRYFCRGPILVPVGGTSLVTFGLRIDQVITGASGTIGITQYREDPDRSDNTAAIVINPAGSGAGSGGSGGGGGLPITGPGGAVGAGLLLMLLGAVALLVTGSRRTRAGV